MSPAQVTVPLNIPDVRVVKTEINEPGRLDHHYRKHQAGDKLSALWAVD